MSPSTTPFLLATLLTNATPLELVNVQTIDPSLVVVLQLAHADNFWGEAMYGEVRECYLRPSAADMLARASERLRKRRRDRRLLLSDCLRPRDVQKRMWDRVAGTDRQGYIANPRRGSLHNYGLAVDVTLADEHGRPLDMGVSAHGMDERGQPRHEARMLALGKLTREQLDNRRLLRDVMREVGFRTVAHEWWHFEAVDLRTARRQFSMVETWASAQR